MKTLIISTRTICGIEELPSHGTAGVTHVLSIVDPGLPELQAFRSYGEHRRTILEFHDIIDPQPGQIMPAPEHVDAILAFGAELDEDAREGASGHLLVHCHMGISRSTAAMVTLMAQGDPEAGEDALFERLREIRPKAWPNSVMIGFADEKLGRDTAVSSGRCAAITATRSITSRACPPGCGSSGAGERSKWPSPPDDAGTKGQAGNRRYRVGSCGIERRIGREGVLPQGDLFDQGSA